VDDAWRQTRHQGLIGRELRGPRLAARQRSGDLGPGETQGLGGGLLLSLGRSDVRRADDVGCRRRQGVLAGSADRARSAGRESAGELGCHTGQPALAQVQQSSARIQQLSVCRICLSLQGFEITG